MRTIFSLNDATTCDSLHVELDDGRITFRSAAAGLELALVFVKSGDALELGRALVAELEENQGGTT